MLKIRCPRHDCNPSGEYQYLGELKSVTYVDEDGKVILSQGTYSYKCMACSMTFSSEIPPQTKRQLNG